MQEGDEDSVAKTPVLGDIPLLGWLFKHKTIIRKKTNLLIFITPHIVKDSTELASITNAKYMDFAKSERHYNDGELLVKFREGVSNETAMQILSDKGASIIKYVEAENLYHIGLKRKQKVEEAINEFSPMPEVISAEPNYKIEIQNGDSSD
jgi:Flp pilus assembly secretin CpaC